MSLSTIQANFFAYHEVTYNIWGNKTGLSTCRTNESFKHDIPNTYAAKAVLPDGWQYSNSSGIRGDVEKKIAAGFLRQLLTNGYVWVKFTNPAYEYYDSIVKMTFYNSFFKLKNVSRESIQDHLWKIKKYRFDVRNPIYFDDNYNGSILRKIRFPFKTADLDTNWLAIRQPFKGSEETTASTTAIFFTDKPLFRLSLSIDDHDLNYLKRQAGYYSNDVHEKYEDAYRRNAFRNNTDGFVWLPGYTGEAELKKNTSGSDKIYPSYKGVVTDEMLVDTLGETITRDDPVFFSNNDVMIMGVVQKIEQNYIFIRLKNNEIIRKLFTPDRFLKITDNMYDNCVVKKLLG